MSDVIACALAVLLECNTILLKLRCLFEDFRMTCPSLYIIIQTYQHSRTQYRRRVCRNEINSKLTRTVKFNYNVLVTEQLSRDSNSKIFWNQSFTKIDFFEIKISVGPTKHVEISCWIVVFRFDTLLSVGS